MALINCPKCGKQISDKAVVCPGCGYRLAEVPGEAFVKCPECGGKVPSGAKMCPLCGYPVDDAVQKETPAADGLWQDALEEDGLPAELGEDRREQADILAASEADDEPQENLSENLADECQEQGDHANSSAAPSKAIKGKRKMWLIVAGLLVGAVALFGVLYSTHIICFHNWQEANCIHPKKCHICKRTVGKKNPDSHWWEPASCAKPKYCLNCGKEVGKKDPNAHRWVDANCVEPKHCAECGEIVGDAIPNKHRLDEREDGSHICLDCGKIFGENGEEDSTDDEAADEAVSTSSGASGSAKSGGVVNGKFSFSPSDFMLYFKGYVGLQVIDKSDSDLIAYVFVEDIASPVLCGMLSFTTMDGSKNLGDDCLHDATCNPSPVLVIDTNEYDSAEMAVAFVQACDPSLSRDDAIDVAGDLADSVSGVGGSTTRNGIEYLLAVDGDNLLLRAVVE